MEVKNRLKILTIVGFFLLCFPACILAQSCSQQSLHDEFTLDPTQRGYPTCAPENDQCVLDKFNAPCLDPACKVDVEVSWETIYEIIDRDELKTLVASATIKPLLDIAQQTRTFNFARQTVRQKLADVFPAATAPKTNQALQALQQKQAPRAQLVCQRPGTLADVSCGRRGEGCS